jgi:carboxyl-terminal processing protease
VALVAVGIVVGVVLPPEPDAPPDTFEALREAYQSIRGHYVEPVTAGALTEHAMRGMLRDLDPHSAYIPPQRMSAIEESFQASFEGIGVTYELIRGPSGQDTIAVVTVVPRGPSDAAGVQPGDRIVAVSGTSAIGWSHERIRSALKGPSGSDVAVTLRRPGDPRPISVRITRDEVPLRTVDASFMLDDSTGYLKLNRFARTTHQELRRALRTLDRHGMQRLILDLRGNAGGFMREAENVADEFLVDDQVIVSARGRRTGRDVVRATGAGIYEDRPLTVLVDRGSASASEIVAGALQDHDRALIVGRRTFGKGLVQRQYTLQDGSGLRVTVARFYTPSGRLIQTPYDGRARTPHALEGGPDASSAPDSLRHRTDAGRLVMGGGGIQPDHVVPREDSAALFRRALEERGLVQDFARRWADARITRLTNAWADRPDAFAESFRLPDETYAAFLQSLHPTGVKLTDAGRVRPESKAARADDASSPHPSLLHPSLSQTSLSQVSFSRRTARAAQPAVEALIRSEIGRRLFGATMWHRLRVAVDPDVQAAQRHAGTARSLAAQYPVLSADPSMSAAHRP